jgi:hypothetical protein
MGLRHSCLGLLLLICVQAWAADVALVMSVQGKVLRNPGALPVPVETYARLGDGEVLGLEQDSRLRVLYFESGRQETWTGPGRLELTVQEGKASGLPSADITLLPPAMARQIARMPASDGNGRVMRTRSVPAPDAIAKLEDSYRALLPARTGPDDLGPEVYLLSGLFEMRELDRVEQVLGELKQERPKNMEAALLISLYRKAVRNARESRR